MTKTAHTLTLTLLPVPYAVCQLDPAAPIPEWAMGDAGASTRAVVCIMRTFAALGFRVIRTPPDSRVVVRLDLTD
jgi:hypothetical protein